jgi:peptide subunit release factor 1 (eRF1)
VETSLAAVDSAVADSYLAGETLVAIADQSGLLYQANLPGAVETQQAVVSPVANLVPLLAGAQPMAPHVVVIIDRLGADLIAVQPDRPDTISAVQGHFAEVTGSAPRGRSQQRFQRRALNRWQANAAAVAVALTRLVDERKPHLVAVCGDIRAVQLLWQQVPTRVADLITVIEGDHHHRVDAVVRGAAAAASVAAAETAAVVADWNQGRSHGLAVRGPQATLSALAAGQVDVLLLDPQQAQRRHAWCGPEPVQAAAQVKDLVAAGVADRRSAPLADVAVRAALAGDAQVRIVPAGTAELAPSGVGAVLRYR